MDITNFDLGFRGPTTVPSTVDLYRKAGTWQGFQGDASAWTLVGSVTIQPSGGGDFVAPVDMPDFVLPANSTNAFYFFCTSYLVEWLPLGSPPVGSIAASNADLSILVGGANNYSLPLTGSGAATPRTWGGTIYYDIAGSTVPEPSTYRLVAPRHWHSGGRLAATQKRCSLVQSQPASDPRFDRE